jgi:uncharacterized membrane protein
MTSDNTPASKGASCRRLRVALIISLALNALIIGAVGGALLLARHGHGWGWQGHKSFGLYGFARTLPQDRRDVIRAAIKDGRVKLKPLRKEVWSARTAARKMLIEQPFEETKLNEALDAVIAADAEYQRAKMAIFAGTAAKLTDEERQELYKWLESHRKHYRYRRHRWRNGDDEKPSTR